MENRKVVCAACKFVARNGTSIILLGVRHWDVLMSSSYRQINVESVREVQGFVDNRGAFLTRTEAMELVKTNGQPFDVSRNGNQDIELYSQGLY